MTQFTGTFSTYDAADGIREELADLITNISPEETPFVSMIGRGSSSNTYSEWLTDSLSAASSTNFQIEGDDLTGYTTATGRVRLGNYAAISRKTVLVTGTQRAVNNAGLSDELGYQVAKMGKELRLDIEKIVCGPQPAVAGNDTTARKTAGFESFLSVALGSAVNNSSTGTTDPTLSGSTKGYPDAAAVEGTARAFSEVILKDVLKQGWTNGANLRVCIVGPVNKARASGFTGIADIRKEAPGTKQATIMGAADVYVGDFGKVTFVPSRLSREKSALFPDPEYLVLDFVRPYQLEDMAKTGDADKRMLVAEYNLRVTSLAAHGIARDLTTT